MLSLFRFAKSILIYTISDEFVITMFSSAVYDYYNYDTFSFISIIVSYTNLTLLSNSSTYIVVAVSNSIT